LRQRVVGDPALDKHQHREHRESGEQEHQGDRQLVRVPAGTLRTADDRTDPDHRDSAPVASNRIRWIGGACTCWKLGQSPRSASAPTGRVPHKIDRQP
jgi:hypothetical protein